MELTTSMEQMPPKEQERSSRENKLDNIERVASFETAKDGGKPIHYSAEQRLIQKLDTW
jgi:hypothetical protein